MATDLRHRVRPQLSLLPAAVALVVGVGVHAVDQALFARAGPIPILLTAPVVATLTYLHVRGATYRRIVALVAGGVVGSGLAVIGVYLRVVNYYLPRPLTAPEMVAYDFAMFLWFVLALAAAYAVAARARGRGEVVALLAGPVAQAAFALVTVLLVESGLYA